MAIAISIEDMKGTILCNRCRKAMTTNVCACGNAFCYISLYWKGKNYTFRRDNHGDVFDFREAGKTLVNINSEIDDPLIKFNPVDWTDLKIKERKFENQIDKWIKEKEAEERNGELSYGTIRDYQGYVRNHYTQLHGKDVRDIDLGNLSELKNSLRDVSIKTRKNIMDALHVFFVWLKDNGVLGVLPGFPEIKGIVPAPYRALEYSVQEEVLSRIPEHHRDIIHFLMETGIRPAEACAIFVGDITPNGCCNIQRTFSKNRLRHTTKQKASRDLPLSDVARSIVQRNMQGKLPTQFLFINPTTGKNYLSDTLWKIWRQFSGVETSLYQGTRHSFGYQLAQHNDLAKVQQLMGHSTIKMTERYAHVKVTTLRDIVNSRGNVISIKGSEKEVKIGGSNGDK